MNSSFSLDGRVALVTGAAGHLGSAIAASLGASGARIVVSGRSKDTLSTLCDHLQDGGSAAEWLLLDVCDPDSILDALDELKRRHGRLDVLVNNASAARIGSIDLIGFDDFIDAAKIDVAGPFALVKHARGLLREGSRLAGGSSVVCHESMMRSSNASVGAHLTWRRNFSFNVAWSIEAKYFRTSTFSA